MISSPTPWSVTVEGVILDFLGNQIGSFNDPRDADVVCNGQTNRIQELEEELKCKESEWESSDGTVQHLDGIINKVDETLKGPSSEKAKLEQITEIIKKYQDGTNYLPIDKR